MPPERVRLSKRAASQDVQLTSASVLPVEMSSAPGIAFAPNVTPGTFNDPPSPSEESSADSLLFPANAEGGAGPRRTAHAKKKPENHIPRPPNAFILFRSSFIKSQHVSSQVETNHSTLSKIIGLTWQNLPHEERQIWHAKAKAALEEHKRKFPQYAFRPLHTKGKAPAEKRKVREVEPKDLKRCEKIAQLLIEGKKGADLNVAIEEFDRHHVPEVVTRFEAPITARHYRRSSSAPAPDTEHSNPPFLSVEVPTPSRRMSKVRSSSSQPETGPYTPVYECSTPSPPPSSEADSDSDFYSSPSPSSPFDTTSIHSYSLSQSNPSFELSTFSFDSNANQSAMSYQACDPLDQRGVFNAYTQDSHESCVPATDMFDPSCLTIDTSFMDSWTASSSPLSSVPGTPQTYASMHAPCDPTSVLDNYLPPLGDYDPSAEYLPQHPPHGSQLYSTGVAAYCAPTGLDIAYESQEFGGVPPKGDFSNFFGRPAVDAVDAAAYAPPYLASMPTYAI